MLRATWYKGTAQLLSLTELKSHLFELYFIGWNFKPMKVAWEKAIPGLWQSPTLWMQDGHQESHGVGHTPQFTEVFAYQLGQHKVTHQRLSPLDTL